MSRVCCYQIVKELSYAMRKPKLSIQNNLGLR
jgi:hypothetical protein